LTVGKRASQRFLKTALKSPEWFSQTLLAMASEILEILWPSPEDVEEHTFPLPVGIDEAAALTLLLMPGGRFAPLKKI
jgi:hypothetical protein